MIAVWGWVLIWSGLVLALVIVLAAQAWRLFRKGLAVLDELGELADATAALDPQEHDVVPPPLAVLQPFAEVERQRLAVKRHRARVREESRQRRLERARRITSVEALQGPWPEAWSEKR